MKNYGTAAGFQPARRFNRRNGQGGRFLAAACCRVPFEDDGYPVQWLGGSVGLLQGSARPGEGVSVLTGHNHLSLTETGPFAFLLQLEPGTKLFVLKENGGLIPFSVIRSESVAAEDISGLETIVDQFENALALVTCENERSSGGYADRRVVIAVPD